MKLMNRVGFSQIEDGHTSGHPLLEAAALAMASYFRSNPLRDNMAFYINPSSVALPLATEDLYGFKVISDRDVPKGYVAFGELGGSE